MLTLEDLQNSYELQEVFTVAPDDPRYTARINEATARLCVRGDFIGPIAVIRLCVNNGCVVWPRHVKSIRRINRCRHKIAHHGLWYDWMEKSFAGCDGRGEGWFGWETWGLGKFGGGHVTDRPTVPCFSDIWGPNRSVRVYPQNPSDVGKTITLFGEDQNGQPLGTLGFNGQSWSDGLVLTLASPYVETLLPSGQPYFIRHIDRVLRQATQQNVTMFGVQYQQAQYIGSFFNPDTGGFVSVSLQGILGDQNVVFGGSTPSMVQVGYLYNSDLQSWQPVVVRGLPGAYYFQYGMGYPGLPTNQGGQLYNNDLQNYQNFTLNGQLGQQAYNIAGVVAPNIYQALQLEPLAVYAPNETRPSYLRTNVCLGCNNGSSTHSIAAIVKLKHIPAVAPTDPLVIDSIYAIKLAVQAIQYENQGELDEAQTYWSMAIEHLNREVEEIFPEDQLFVDDAPFSHARGFGSQRCF